MSRCSPETLALLLRCAGAAARDRRTREADGLIARVGQEDLPAMAEAHGILPLVCRHLARDDDVPEPVQRQLDDLARRNARRNLFLTSQLIDITSALEQRGIPTIPFKGPALAALAYGDLSFRQSADLDIFVRRTDVAAARAVLLALGFDGIFPRDPGGQRRFIRSQYELELSNHDDVHVDVHWDVVLRRYAVDVDIEAMWQRAGHVKLAGRSIRAFSPEDLLLLLCVHGAKHRWRKIGWICDVVELLRSAPALEWSKVQARAKEAGAERMVRLGLVLAVDLLDTIVPPAASSWMREDAAVAALASRIRQSYETGDDAKSPFFNLARFQLAARERWRDRARYLWRAGFTPTKADWELVPLPGPLAFAYTVLHPFRLLAKYGSRAGHQLIVDRIWSRRGRVLKEATRKDCGCEPPENWQ